MRLLAVVLTRGVPYAENDGEGVVPNLPFPVPDPVPVPFPNPVPVPVPNGVVVVFSPP